MVQQLNNYSEHFQNNINFTPLSTLNFILSYDSYIFTNGKNYIFLQSRNLSQQKGGYYGIEQHRALNRFQDFSYKSITS